MIDQWKLLKSRAAEHRFTYLLIMLEYENRLVWFLRSIPIIRSVNLLIHRHERKKRQLQLGIKPCIINVL